jgi:cAMP phosphodiesterase
MKAKAIVNGSLIRKQFLVSYSQVEKLSFLSASEGKSEAEIVRLAIDAFDPNGASNINTPELMELVAQRLELAIRSTQQANAVVAKALENLAS